MTHTAFRSLRQLLVAVLIFLCQLACGQVSRASTATKISATYDVLQRTSLAGREQIHVRIRLVNHGPTSVLIKKMALWTSSLPEKGAVRVCALPLAAHSSTTTQQEFTVRSADYQHWRTGTPPRLILQLASRGKSISKQVIRLEPVGPHQARFWLDGPQRISAQEVK